MSTNPTTKTYWTRVQRLANKIYINAFLGSSYIDLLGGETAENAILRVIKSADPGATRQMQAKAMEIATKRATDMILFHEEEIARAKRTLSALESAPWFRQLRLVSNDH